MATGHVIFSAVLVRLQCGFLRYYFRNIAALDLSVMTVVGDKCRLAGQVLGHSVSGERKTLSGCAPKACARHTHGRPADFRGTPMKTKGATLFSIKYDLLRRKDKRKSKENRSATRPTELCDCKTFARMSGRD